jgi:hypothetical protein
MKKKIPPQRPKSNKYKEIKNPERGTRMNLQQRHYLANMNSGSKIIAALTDENPSSAKAVVESTLLRKAGECIKENVGPAVDKSPINEGYHEESYHEGLQAGYLYASHCYKESMGRREGMRRLNASARPHGMMKKPRPPHSIDPTTFYGHPASRPNFDPDNELHLWGIRDMFGPVSYPNGPLPYELNAERVDPNDGPPPITGMETAIYHIPTPLQLGGWRDVVGNRWNPPRGAKPGRKPGGRVLGRGYGPGGQVSG